MRSDRYEKKQKKKKRKWKLAVLFLLLIIAGTLAYAYYQFNQGVAQSEDKVKNTNEVKYEFNGETDKYGGTNDCCLEVMHAGKKRRGPIQSW